MLGSLIGISAQYLSIGFVWMAAGLLLLVVLLVVARTFLRTRPALAVE